MRHHFPPKLQSGQIDIANIHIDYRSRDDIPQLLRGLQEIYKTPEVIGGSIALSGKHPVGGCEY